MVLGYSLGTIILECDDLITSYFLTIYICCQPGTIILDLFYLITYYTYGYFLPTWYHSWRLVVDAHFESSWTPVYKLNGPLCFDRCYGSIHVLGHHITSVQHTAGHVLSLAWIAFHHLVVWLKTSVGDLLYSQLFMVSLLS